MIMEVIKVLLVEDDAGDHLIIKDLLEDSQNFNYTCLLYTSPSPRD